MIMKRKLLYFIISGLIPLFCSCSHEIEIIMRESTVPFCVEVHASNFVSEHELVNTRTSEVGYTTTFTNGDKIGITMVAGGSIVDGMDNVCYTYNNGSWEPDPSVSGLFYYPGVTYLAYYPYQPMTMNGKMSIADIKSTFIASMNLEQDEYSGYTAADLMTCEVQSSSLNSENPKLKIDFIRQMSLVIIHPRGQHYQTSDGYDFYAPPKEVTTFQIGSVTAAYQPGDCTYRAIVPPGTIDVTISYVTTEDVTLQYTGTLTTAVGKYNELLLTPASPALPYILSVGDYFFTDGGLLPHNTATLTEAHKKNCAGLVFYSGKHASDSGTYTDKNGGVMDVHGYVIVAAPKIYSCAWGSQDTDRPDGVGTSKNTSDFMGYDNTQKIKTKALTKNSDATATSGLSTDANNNYPATYYALFVFEKDCPSPKGCSGWFLPSYGQLSAVRSQKDKLTENLNKLGRNTLFTNRYSWTSTETGSTGQHSYGYNLSTGSPNSAGKGAGWYSPIATLAF